MKRMAFGVWLVCLGLAATAHPPDAAAQAWARLDVPAAELGGALSAARPDYENLWNGLFVASLRAGLARADSAAHWNDLARRVAEAEPPALGSHIAPDALALRARWTRAQRQLRVAVAVTESLAIEARTARDWPRADSLYRDALAGYRKLGEKRREAWVLGGLGVVALGSGRNDRALEAYGEALTARRALGDPRLLGNTLNDLGQTYLKLERYADARTYLTEAAEVRERTSQMPALGASLGFLGSALLALGERDSADVCFSRSLALLSAAGDSARTLVTLVNFGAMLIDQGEADRATAIYTRAALIARQREDNNLLAILESNLGSLQRMNGHFTEALRHEEVAAALSAADPPRLAVTLNDLGRTLNEMGDPDRAQHPLGRALALSDSLGDDALAARTLVNLAAAASAAGDSTGARRLAARAVDRAVAAGDSALVRDAAAMVAQIAIDSGDPVTGGRWLDRALAAAANPRPELYAALLTNRALAWHLEGRLDAAERMDREALKIAEEVGAADLVGNILTNLGDIAERRGDFPKALARYGEALARIDSLRAGQHGQRAAVKTMASRVYVHEAMIHLLGKLDAAEPDSGYGARAFEWAERARSRALLDLASTAAGQSGAARMVTLAEAQGRLRSDHEALLEYSVGDSSTSLWVIRRSAWRLVHLPPRAALRSRVVALRRGLGDPHSADGERTRELTQQLYRLLVGPAEPLLEGVDRLVISPDGPLALLPFEALRVTREGSSKAPYLIERFDVRYTPSASAVALERPGRSSGAIIAVGNPTFPQSSEAGPVLAPLPNTQYELACLDRLARGGEFVELDGARATARGVQALPQLAGASILHFATHGDVNEAEPELSGLWLAPDSGSVGASRLEVADILQLRLSADLVTLSACQTGLGRMERGEGVLGLQHAFLAAGARSTLVSLWSVDDRSTAALMDAFYSRALGGREDRATALAKAKRKLLASSASRSPFYWAPFVLVGDPGSNGR